MQCVYLDEYKKALHFVHCKILNYITTEMLQKILNQIIQTVQHFLHLHTHKVLVLLSSIHVTL